MNKQEKRAYDRLYYQKNRQRRLEQAKQWAAGNEAARKEIEGKYRNRNQTEIRERKAAWHRRAYQEDPERFLAEKRTVRGRFNDGKNKAKQRGYAWLLTLEEYKAILAENRCHYCRGELNRYGSGLDRKNNEPFYGVNSAVACCHDCNAFFGSRFDYPARLALARLIRDYNNMLSLHAEF